MDPAHAQCALTAERAGRSHSNVSANERTAAERCDVPCFKTELVARLRREVPEDDELEEIRTRFAALADRTRLKVLYALVHGGELCVCDVAHVVGMSVSAASHHLRKLRDLRILTYRTDGKMAYYSIVDREVARLVRHAVARSAA